MKNDPAADFAAVGVQGVRFEFFQRMACTESVVYIRALGDLLLRELHGGEQHEVDGSAAGGLVLPDTLMSSA